MLKICQSKTTSGEGSTASNAPPAKVRSIFYVMNVVNVIIILLLFLLGYFKDIPISGSANIIRQLFILLQAPQTSAAPTPTPTVSVSPQAPAATVIP